MEHRAQQRQRPLEGAMMVKSMSERARFTLVGFGALAVLLPLWWSIADIPIGLAQPLAAMIAKVLGLITDSGTRTENGWAFATPYWITVGPENLLGKYAKIGLGEGEMKFAIRSLPIFMALMLAPPWSFSSLWKMLVGLVVLYVYLALTALALINMQVSILLAGKPNPVFANSPPPSLSVLGTPYGEFSFWLAGALTYLALFFASLILPVMLWAILKPEAVALLMRRKSEADETEVPPVSPHAD
jgi:hypothetical protein